MLWSYNCQSPTHTTVGLHSNWWSKAIIIQLYTGAGKIANEGTLYCKISLNELTAVKVNPPSPVLLTHNSELELSLGCLAKQALTASPLHFERPQWLEHGLRPCSSENFSSYLLANSLRYQGPNAWNSVKNPLITLDLLSLAHRMPFWRETRR